MRVPLTVRDFIDRAELVYGDRIGLVDEPDAQAPSWGAISEPWARRGPPWSMRARRRRRSPSS